MDKRLQAQEKQAQLAQNDGPENIAERVNQILEQALRQRASDIHIEPTETHLRIRLRVDGVLHALPLLAPELAAPVIARLKVPASLDIAEHRLPQDGQFALNLAGRPLSFRIATLPCRYGEKIVLRLLHQVDQALDLESTRTLILPAGGLSPGAEPAAGSAAGHRPNRKRENGDPLQRPAGQKP